MRTLIFILFFLSVFAGFMTPMELGDVWWHLSTGQWILENMSLPDNDPFTIASDTRDHSFVLQGFWLSQVLLRLIQSATGLIGLIMFKSLLFTSAVAILWLGARRQGASNTLAFLSIVPAIMIFSFYDEARPQTFSILFTALTFLVLEHSRRQGQRLRMGDHLAESSLRQPQPQQKQGRPWFPALIPIMIVWANMHPGFVIGIGLLTLYAAEHLSVTIINKESRPNAFFLIACLASILLAGLNPNGFEAVSRTLSMLKQSAFGTVTIHEHLGVSQFVQRTGETALMVSFIFVACAGLAGFLLKRRSLDLLHLFMFLSLGALSLVTFRAGLFFAIASAHIFGYNLSGLSAPLLEHKGRRMAVITAICLLGVAAGLAGTRSIAARGIMSPGIFPDKAAAYIEDANAPANLYHPYEWGGYLIWRLYPGYRAFIDGRVIMPIQEHFEVQNAGPRWSEILRHRDVSTVLFWPMLPYKKRVPPIVFALAGDPGWRAVHWDTRSLVFVRSGKAVRPLRQSTVWELLQSLAMQGITNNPTDPEYYIALGEIYANRGLPGQAREIFRRALSLDPGNKEAAHWLRLL